MPKGIAKKAFLYCMVASVFLVGCQKMPSKPAQPEHCSSAVKSCISPVLLSEYQKNQQAKLAKNDSYQNTLNGIKSLFDSLAVSWVSADVPALLDHYWPSKSPVEGLTFVQWKEQVHHDLPAEKAFLRFYDIELLHSTAITKKHAYIRVKQERKIGKVHDFTYKYFELVKMDTSWLIDKEKVLSHTLLSMPELAVNQVPSIEPVRSSSLSANPSSCPSISDIKSSTTYTVQLIVSSQFDKAKSVVSNLGADAFIYQSVTGNFVSVYGAYTDKAEAYKQVRRLKNKQGLPQDFFVSEFNSERIKQIFCSET